VNVQDRSNPLAFILVGCTAAAVHMLTALVLVEKAAATPAMANIAAFFCAFAVSFTGHRCFTFDAREKVVRSMGKWLAVALGGFLVNQSLYMTALTLFPQIDYLASLFVVTAFVAFISYRLGKRWAFLSL